jgi:hypothetical protein
MVYTFNPLQDARWPGFVDRHGDSSVFHGRGWLDALHRTYGYEPVVYSTSPPEADLTNGVLFCRVSSWVTGRRLVSLHCEPLVADLEQRTILSDAFTRMVGGDRPESKLKYIELRPRRAESWETSDGMPSHSFAFHVLDLRPSINELYRGIHKSTLQRRIRRAEGDSVSCEAGRSEALLNKFYRLLLLTRRRHRLPPQPIDWFRNLIACLGDHLTIRVASKDAVPLAAVLTLSHRETMVYKYGCSDARYHYLGAMPFVLWKSIEDAKELGFARFDLGRSDYDNSGLITFKDRWGADRSELSYLRYARSRSTRTTRQARGQLLRQAFAWMPDRILTATGKLLYRHIG